MQQSSAPLHPEQVAARAKDALPRCRPSSHGDMEQPKAGGDGAAALQ